jgi:23S rRNA (adenine2503-C2)-methyltransferase
VTRVGLPPHFLDGGPERLRDRIVGLDQKAYRARQLWEAFRRNPDAPGPVVRTWPSSLTDRFFGDVRWCWHRSVVRFADPDGTRKWEIELCDGLRIHCVMIPDADRRTLCISSQVGCAMACAFCSTGDMGYRRNLGAGEIVSQWLYVDAALCRETGRGLTQMVFMGMGEPLHNLDEVLSAIAWFTDERGCALSPSRITVSTVGVRHALERLIVESRVHVAISLHAADPAVRRAIVPAERGYPAEEIADLLRRHRNRFRQRKLTAEVVLIPGVNDRESDARALVRWAHGLPLRVNLIPFNPYPGSRFTRPSAAAVTAYQNRLRAAGISTFVRKTRGESIAAACGTLNTLAAERNAG